MPTLTTQAVARCLACALPLLVAATAWSAPQPPANSPCASIPHADHPHAYLTNGAVELVLFLPDATNGYYRSSRFDWSGLVACASYRGRTYFGEWFDKYDPTINDAVTGPAEEFRADDGKELGYAEAGADGEFVKPGVGVLKKTGDTPYKFGTSYPIVDHGSWTTKVSKHSVTFTQVLHSKLGYSYRYTKIVELDPHRPVFRLRHTLVNLGTKDIETQVYDHDFFMLDHAPTGPHNVVTFGFTPTFSEGLPDILHIDGNALHYLAAPDKTHTAWGYVTGYTGASGEYRVRVENTDTGTAILQTSDAPVSRSYFWSTPKTICPELYTPIHVPTGGKQSWTLQYELQANTK